jgi:hypothetical protein
VRVDPPLPAGQPPAASPGPAKPRPLSDADAIEIWIARWLRVRPIDLARRYDCDSRRLYDIWWEQAFAGSKARARKLFLERYPGAADRTDFGYRRIPRGRRDDPRQRRLFD